MVAPVTSCMAKRQQTGLVGLITPQIRNQLIPKTTEENFSQQRRGIERQQMPCANMTRSGQSREDPTLSMPSNRCTFSPKSNTRIGCWNVRSLGRPGKQNSRLRDVLRTMKEKNIEILALSEVRWPGQGSLQCDGRLMLYSGVAENQPCSRSKGVALVLGSKAIAGWREAGSVMWPISERILKIRLKISVGFVSILSIYAPTNEENMEEETEKFYSRLQDVVCSIPKRDMLLILGDFNARVGCDSSTWEGVMGNHGPSELNENGRRLLEFCTCNNLVVTNTLFKHRPCHQHTWFHPAEGNLVGHVLDYVLVSHRFRSSVLDTRVFRKTYLQSTGSIKDKN